MLLLTSNFFLISFSASTTFFCLNSSLASACLLLAIEKKIVKQLSGTRWSARADAVTCLNESYDEIKKVLESLIKDRSQTKETQNEAQNLIMKMNTFDFFL